MPRITALHQPSAQDRGRAHARDLLTFRELGRRARLASPDRKRLPDRGPPHRGSRSKARRQAPQSGQLNGLFPRAAQPPAIRSQMLYRILAIERRSLPVPGLRLFVEERFLQKPVGPRRQVTLSEQIPDFNEQPRIHLKLIIKGAWPSLDQLQLLLAPAA